MPLNKTGGHVVSEKYNVKKISGLKKVLTNHIECFVSFTRCENVH